MNFSLPRMAPVRQIFSLPPPLDIRAALAAEMEKIRPRLKPGQSIAVGVGSRGIASLPTIVKTVLDQLKTFGAIPFLFPAMGSHGGATPEGQTEMLATLGVTETAMGVPIRASMEVRHFGRAIHGTPVFCSVEALRADGILLVNRVKPHTDFTGSLGSGLLKMCAVGLGKHEGARALHAAAEYHGHEPVIRSMAKVLLDSAPVIGGVAILENQVHDVAQITVLTREEMPRGEDQLFGQASQWMPRLPFDEIDLLIIDRIGKNISGVGLDPNVTGRWPEGYSTCLSRNNRPAPFIRRIFVRDLTEETHGNALGLGLADATTTRVALAMSHRATYTNSLTALSLNCAKIPIQFDTDREAIHQMLISLGLPNPSDARVVRIRDTLSLSRMEISAPFWAALGPRHDLTALSPPAEMQFDASGNLSDPLRSEVH